LQAACAQQFDGFGQVFVGAFAREDFVADDDEAEVGVMFWDSRQG
jgi:hypothetical protein